MGCCGQQRQDLRNKAEAQRRRDQAGIAPPTSASVTFPDAYFQYLGDKALTVVGPVSRIRYRFERHGAVVAVDPRDRRSLSAIPQLKQVG